MSAVWSWSDVPGLDAPPPPPAPRVAVARHRWSLASLPVNEHMPAPVGATLRQALSAISGVARRRGLRFAVHVTEANGLFVRRVPPGASGPGVEIMRGPVPASSRLTAPEGRAP